VLRFIRGADVCGDLLRDVCGMDSLSRPQTAGYLRDEVVVSYFSALEARGRPQTASGSS
jgi:hypothetical protein